MPLLSWFSVALANSETLCRLDVPFPLTPTLSLGERENCRPILILKSPSI